MHVELMRDTRTEMPALNPETESLRIWHCNYRTLHHVASLRKLRTLIVATYPDETLALLAQLSELRHLRIVHLPKVRDLAPLAGLTRLETLELATLPSWDASGKTTIVESLEPLAALPSLTHLALFGVVSKTKSLAALERCPALVSVRVSKYPKAETSRLYATGKISADDVPEPPTG
jgi:hypothetical protein